MGREDVQRPTRKVIVSTAPPRVERSSATQPKPTPPQQPQRPQKPQHSRTAQVQHQNKQQVHPIQKAVTQSPIPQAHAMTQSTSKPPYEKSPYLPYHPSTPSGLQKGESLEMYHQRIDPVGHIRTQVGGAATEGWKVLETGVNLTPYGQAVGAIKTAVETPYSGQTQTDTRKNQVNATLNKMDWSTAPMASSPQQGGDRIAAGFHDGQTGKPNFENKIMQKHYKKGHHYTLNKEGQKVYHKKQKDTAVEWQQNFQQHTPPTGQHKNIYQDKKSKLLDKKLFGKDPSTMNVLTQGIWGRKGDIKGDTVLYKAPIYKGGIVDEQRQREQEHKQQQKIHDKYIFDFFGGEKKQRRKDKFFQNQFY